MAKANKQSKTKDAWGKYAPRAKKEANEPEHECDEECDHDHADDVGAEGSVKTRGATTAGKRRHHCPVCGRSVGHQCYKNDHVVGCKVHFKPFRSGNECDICLKYAKIQEIKERKMKQQAAAGKEKEMKKNDDFFNPAPGRRLDKPRHAWYKQNKA